MRITGYAGGFISVGDVLDAIMQKRLRKTPQLISRSLRLFDGRGVENLLDERFTLFPRRSQRLPGAFSLLSPAGDCLLFVGSLTRILHRNLTPIHQLTQNSLPLPTAPRLY
ncbi:MAG: hypothetical protein M3Y27_04200 [Acidobacteriota bacterium]|nr:hypothetical protein [Acidobacteriota bacterium]